MKYLRESDITRLRRICDVHVQKINSLKCKLRSQETKNAERYNSLKRSIDEIMDARSVSGMARAEDRADYFEQFKKLKLALRAAFVLMQVPTHFVRTNREQCISMADIARELLDMRDSAVEETEYIKTAFALQGGPNGDKFTEDKEA